VLRRSSFGLFRFYVVATYENTFVLLLTSRHFAAVQHQMTLMGLLKLWRTLPFEIDLKITGGRKNLKQIANDSPSFLL
jgi:hypothetical protein